MMTMMGNEGNEGNDVIEDIDVLRKNIWTIFDQKYLLTYYEG